MVPQSYQIRARVAPDRGKAQPTSHRWLQETALIPYLAHQVCRSLLRYYARFDVRAAPERSRFQKKKTRASSDLAEKEKKKLFRCVLRWNRRNVLARSYDSEKPQMIRLET